MSNRLPKINETLRHEIGMILIELAEQNWGIVTITSVQISPDLKDARIWLSAEQRVVDKINALTPEIRHTLRPRITFKHIPNLKFIKDDESIAKLEEILETIDET